jgi:aminoglycoside phosphotransferase family enzyme
MLDSALPTRVSSIWPFVKIFGVLDGEYPVLGEITAAETEPSLGDKVAFLSRGGVYPETAADVVTRETHMSWVFLVGEKAYKLKKPVKFPYLDFSTLQHREAACLAELRLNLRLAPAVYLGVSPLRRSPGGLSLGGDGKIVDWLVVMRRLDEEHMLHREIEMHFVDPAQLDRLASILVRFYARTQRVFTSPEATLCEWRRNLAYNRRVLLNPCFEFPARLVWRIDRAQRRFLAESPDLLVERIRARRVVDGHGDLRPEHIWLGASPQIIDCLEFNATLRAVDPFDELAYLSLECERLGTRWVGERIARRVARGLRDGAPEELFCFYRCYRATLRARLAIAHLLEPNPRTPEKWPALARAYLRIAEQDAMRIERSLRKRASRRASRLPATAGSHPQRGPRLAAHRSFGARGSFPNEMREPYR